MTQKRLNEMETTAKAAITHEADGSVSQQYISWSPETMLELIGIIKAAFEAIGDPVLLVDPKLRYLWTDLHGALSHD